MSENGEGLTRNQILQSELDALINDPKLTDKEIDAKLAGLAKDETQFHTEGRLNKVPGRAEVTTGAARKEIHVASDGVVMSSAEDVVEQNAALRESQLPGRG